VERLEGKNCLVVIDDVWDPAHLEPFLRGGAGCARLITSRQLQVATDVQAQRLLVDEMSGSEAVAMLTANGRASTLNALAVLPGGRLASGSSDCTIKLWDPTSAEPESNHPQFIADAAITSLAFLPAPPTLVAGDASGRLHWLRLPGP
jgi:WD40 repeat protein